MDVEFAESFGRYFAVFLWRRKLQVVLLCPLAIALTWLAYGFVTPIYDASALVQVNLRRPYAQTDASAAADGAARQDEYLNTQAMIISSNDVVHSVIAEIGADTLYPQDTSLKSKIFPKVDDLFASESERDRLRAQADDAKALAALTVRPERKTDLIKISFRHPDPELAARFVNLLVKKYIDRHIELSSSESGAAFMENERLKFENEFSRASAALTNFSTANDLYSADAQMTILLDRRKTLQVKISDTTGGIAEREAQVGELTRQFVLLKLDARAPQLAALRRETAHTAPNATISRGAGPLPDDVPPLMLVRVYQSTAEILVKTNADLLGLRELLSQQKTELANLDRELLKLAGNRAEFERLQRKVDLARRSAEAFAVKAVEQKTEMSLGQKRLVRPQSVQDAIAPAWPSSPTTAAKLLTGVLLAIAGVVGMALHSFFASRRRSDEEQLELARPKTAMAHQS